MKTSRALYHLCLLLILLLILLSILLSLTTLRPPKLLPHHHQASQQPQTHLPLPLPIILTSSSSLQLSEQALRLIPFSHPRVLTSYLRPSLNHPSPAIDLVLFTSGLSLRNLSVSHCLIEHAIIPVLSYVDEIAFCRLPFPPQPRSRLSVVLVSDNSLQQARLHDLPLTAGHIAKRLQIPTHLLRVLSSPSPPRLALQSSTEFDPSLQDDTALGGVIRGVRNSTRPIRYEVCMATMTSTTADALPEWVDYHRRLGVDHVYLFDNGHLPGTLSHRFVSRHDVSVISWPFQKSQTQMLTFITLASRPRCKRLIRLDSDEYIFLPSSSLGRTISPLLSFLRETEQRSETGHVLFPGIVMWNSGQILRPRPHVPYAESFVHRLKHSPEAYLGKSSCQTDVDWRASRVHRCGMVGNRLYRPSSTLSTTISTTTTSSTNTLLDDMFDPNCRPTTQSASNVVQQGLVVHFYGRSWEEWVEKWDAGSATVIPAMGADQLAGKFEVHNPDPKFVNVSASDRVPFPCFRAAFRAVMAPGQAWRLRSVAVERSDESGVAHSLVVQLP